MDNEFSGKSTKKLGSNSTTKRTSLLEKISNASMSDEAAWLKTKQIEDALKMLEDINAKVGKIDYNDINSILQKLGLPGPIKGADGLSRNPLAEETKHLHGVALAKEKEIPLSEVKDASEIGNELYSEYKRITGRPFSFKTQGEIEEELKPIFGKEKAKEYANTMFGASQSIQLRPPKNINRKIIDQIYTNQISNPFDNRIFLNKTKMDEFGFNPLQKLSVLGHEFGHFKSDITSPASIQMPKLTNWEDLASNPFRFEIGIPEMSTQSKEALKNIYNKLGPKSKIKNIEDISPKEAAILYKSNDEFRNVIQNEIGNNEQVFNAITSAYHHPTHPTGYELEQIQGYVAGVPNLSSKLEQARLLKQAEDQAIEYHKRGLPTKKAAGVFAADMSSNSPNFQEEAVTNASRALAPYIKSAVDTASPYAERALTELSRPGAAFRGVIHALQKEESPSKAFVSAASNPETAPTGYDIVEKLNIPEDQVALNTALATGIDLFADPINLIPAGGASKIVPPKTFGNLKSLLKK